MENKYFYSVVVGFVIGSAVQTTWSFGLPTITWFFFLGFCLLLLWHKNIGKAYVTTILMVVIFLVLLGTGLLRSEVASWQFGISPLEDLVQQEVTLTGIVEREPDVRERNVHLYTRVNNDLVLVSTDRHTSVAYGDEITFSGKLEKPEAFTTDLGRTFDYDKYLLAKGVEYQVSFVDIEVVGEGEGSRVIAMLLATKQTLMEGIERVLPEPQAGLGEGLLLGVKQALGDDLEEDFRKTGIIHIVVLSGYNIMLVVAFFIFFLSFLFKRRLRMVFGVIAIVGFALIVGLSATVVRASIMASLLLVAQAYGRTYDVLRALFIAGLVMIIINPYLLLYDIGFQLSFMATLGLVLLAPTFEATVARVPTSLGFKDFFVATLATQVAVLPLLLYHIGEISLIAVLVNVLVLPIVPVAMLFTFIGGLVGLVSVTLAIPFTYVAYACLSYIIYIATWFAGLPFASVSVPEFAPGWIFAMYAVLAGGFWYWANRKEFSDEFADWEIEEESEVKPKSWAPKGAQPTKDTPIFFR